VCQAQTLAAQSPMPPASDASSRQPALAASDDLTRLLEAYWHGRALANAFVPHSIAVALT